MCRGALFERGRDAGTNRVAFTIVVTSRNLQSRRGFFCRFTRAKRCDDFTPAKRLQPQPLGIQLRADRVGEREDIGVDLFQNRRAFADFYNEVRPQQRIDAKRFYLVYMTKQVPRRGLKGMFGVNAGHRGSIFLEEARAPSPPGADRFSAWRPDRAGRPGRGCRWPSITPDIHREPFAFGATSHGYCDRREGLILLRAGYYGGGSTRSRERAQGGGIRFSVAALLAS